MDKAPGSPPTTSYVSHCSLRRENPPATLPKSHEDFGNIAAEVANIYDVDRLDSLRALQMRKQNRTVAATSEFISMEELLRTQAEPAPGQEIVDMILRDFCSSPTYVEEEDLLTCESPPWFRFRKKKMRTYARKQSSPQQNVLSVAIEADDEGEDDRLSCSSGLSVQEDHTAPRATSVCELDANTSQKICENLLNLSQYFSLSNPTSSSNSHPNKDHPPAVSIEIDLPTKVDPDRSKPSCSREQRSNLSDTNSSAECTSIELDNLETDLLGIGFTFEATEICDIKPRAPGNLGDTLFDDGKASTTIVQSQLDSKVCADWSEGDSILENYNTEKISLNDEELEAKLLLIDKVKTELIGAKSEDPESCTQNLLDDIPISEWQTPMDIPDESIKETPELSQKEVKKSQARTNLKKQFSPRNPLDEWQPMEIPEFVGFRTASDKPIVISEEMKERAAKLLADIDETEPKPPSDRATESSEFVGFRTASNKAIEITEEMASKGAMFIAQFQTSDQLSQSNDAKILQNIAFSEWEPIDIPEKTTKVPEKEELNQSINISHLKPPETKTPSRSQSVNIPQLVAFRKTPYKFMEVAEEMKVKGDMLMAEVESGLYQPSQRRSLQNTEVIPIKEPINRAYEGGEELERKAAAVQAVVEFNSEFVGFRTASDKPIVVSEEMKIKAAQFMAEFQTVVSNREHEGTAYKDTGNTEFIDKPIVVSESIKREAKVEASSSNQQNEDEAVSAISNEEFVGFRTASNKAIVVSEAMKAKAAKFMTEFQAESPQNICLNAENTACDSDDNPKFFGFRTASNKRIEISEEMKSKAAKLMADVHAGSEVNQNQKLSSDNECLSDISDNVSGEEFKGFPENGILPLSIEEERSNCNDSIFPRLSQTTKDDSKVSTPRQRRDTYDGIPSSKRLRKISNSPPEQNRQEIRRIVHKTTSCHSALGTPIQSQEIHASLTQLAGLSPLDQKTKTSVIARRNLLTLSKRRKRSRTPTGTLAGNTITPIKSRLAAMPSSTSTPLADRNMNHVQDSTATKHNAEDMSPICMPPNKSRRLGLSRSRN
ncbi:breast cancer type 2 susceptibility protein homolog [Drosophila serrata]|uniref:breast cancer type 2 susceptibility protein homolog n=1 Tax=Drosophila serrata TaxID=7274 RepID=UPI000A1D26AA|nr:breast cancer type 2 susceptibility protein homolog [Drosophila serrata]